MKTAECAAPESFILMRSRGMQNGLSRINDCGAQLCSGLFPETKAGGGHGLFLKVPVLDDRVLNRSLSL